MPITRLMHGYNKIMIDIEPEHQHAPVQQQPDPPPQPPAPAPVPTEEEEEETEWSDVPCHPHRKVQALDFTKIDDKIKLIRQQKQAAREAYLRLRRKKTPDELFEEDILEANLNHSLNLVPLHVGLSIKQRLKFLEEKVYLSAQNDNYGELVARIKQETLSNEALANELNLVMHQVHLGIENDIEAEEYDIRPIQRKQKVIPLEPEPAHRVKLKNMLVKRNLNELKDEINRSQVGGEAMAESVVSPGSNPNSSRVTSMDRSQVAERKEGEVWGDEFHIMSEGTKKAQQFIKRIRAEQDKIRVDKVRRGDAMKSLEVKSAMQHKQFQAQMKKERHESLRKRHEERRELKKAQRQQQQQKQQDYHKFLKDYKQRKPLFRLRQQQYLKNVVEEQNRRREAQLQQIHEAKKPVTHKELVEHEKQYEKVKEEKKVKHDQERQLRKKEEADRPSQHYFRSRFHSIVVEKDEAFRKDLLHDTLDDKMPNIQRGKQFGQEIRKKYAPQISEPRKKQLDDMANKLEDHRTKKRALSEAEYKQLGNSYLRELRTMLDQLRKKGLLKKEEEQASPQKKTNYLREVSDRYAFERVNLEGQDPQWVSNKAARHEKDAKMKEKVLRYQDNQHFDFEKYMSKLEAIDQDYVQSAEAKMALISRISAQQQQPTNQSRVSEMSLSNEEDEE